MKLLITTQAVDLDDPVLGFFHAWIVTLAARVESVEVICLQEGRHALPKNVHVHALGKRAGKRTGIGDRFRYTVRLKYLVWKLRHQYDSVFVHMNEEYVLIAGSLWRLFGKRVILED